MTVSKDKVNHYCGIAIDNVLKEGITDVELFSSPFELLYLKNDIFKNDVKTEVVNRIMKWDFKELKLNKIGHVLVPKKDLCDFRKCAMVDIIDEIIFLTLALIVARPVERERIKASENRVFSYRYNINNGYLFNPKYHFTAFKNEVTRKSIIKTNKVVVECDISNYYDRLNIHRIESALLSFNGVDKDVAKMLNDILLYWANRDSYGIPVGSNASRILAEAALVNVDRYLKNHKVDFCRFVDDYRIFAKDAETAHKHLALLTHCLSREGLFINTTKTKMKDISRNEHTAVYNMVEATDESPVNDNKFDNENIDRTLPKIIRGYNGLIPTKFRELTGKEKSNLQKIDINILLQELISTPLVEAEEVKKLIKCVKAQNRFEIVDRLPSVLVKFPQFIPYFVDFIKKNEAEIDDSNIETIVESFSDLFRQDDVPEYILVYLVRLFKMVRSGREALLVAFRNLKRNSGVYIGRALLESFDENLSRTDVLEIRESFIRSDRWEKRQILRLVRNVLPEDERRAFFTDVKIHNDDLFVNAILSTKADLAKITK